MSIEQLPACTLHQISDHVRWFTPESHTDRPSLCAVVGENAVALLDIGASPAHTQEFLDALSKEGIAAPDYAILTHWHWDHVFGIDALSCPVIAHEESNRNIKRMMTLDYSDANLANLIAEGHEVEFTREHLLIELTESQRKNLILREADITFTQSIRLHLGDVTCDVQHVGGDHASDSAVIYIPEDKILFLGDCFYYTVYQEPRHYTEAKILPLIDKLEYFDVEYFVLGHNGQIVPGAVLRKEFPLIRSIYKALHQQGQENLSAIKSELYKKYDNEDVDDYIEPIVTGINLE